MSWFCGLDLGQSHDHTALAMLEQVDVPPVDVQAETFPYYIERRPSPVPPVLQIRYLERFPLGTPYPTVVTTVGQRLAQLPGCAFVVDRTGVGRGVYDMFVAAGLGPIGITITSGDTAAQDEEGAWKVPKRDLVASVQVPLQNGRLKIAEGLRLARVLTDELLKFKVKITAAANDTYGAWREGDHDDLVLAVALAAWQAQRSTPFRPVAGGQRRAVQEARRHLDTTGKGGFKW